MTYTQIAAGEDATAAAMNALLAQVLSGGSGGQMVVTSQTTASTTFADLATVGPAVTLTSVGTLALVMYECQMSNSALGAGTLATVAVSGATTAAASDDECLSHDFSMGVSFRGAAFRPITINPGANTYTMKYRVGAGIGTFLRRRIFVIAP